MSSGSTIFALATAPGRAGVAIIRISGPKAAEVCKQLAGKAPKAGQSAYVTFKHPETSEVVDRGLALFFKAPASFTGEDVAELHVHGSMAVVRELLELLSHMEGVVHAEPGEFSRRAFLNGKMDLIEAEGLADLIAADTLQQKAQALRQMEGRLSSYYEELRGRVLVALAHLEAYIDFPDEDIPEEVLTGLGQELRELSDRIAAALADDRRGEAMREGLHVVIVGAPNAGKSSLLNRLAGRDAAIVSTQAGTTRDSIEVRLDLAGYPVILTDTAGLRESSDEVESEGIRRTFRRAQTADIIITLFDGSAFPSLDSATLELVDERTLVAVNKADMGPVTVPPQIDGAALISAKTGEGIEGLLAALGDRAGHFFGSGDMPMITRERHRALLKQAQVHLENVGMQQALELACEELRQAALCIGKITGKIEVDDVLEVVFKQFCIGK